MITLTRLSGSVFALNADLIERVESTPDTVITLVDGKKYVVAESMSEVIAVVRANRAEIVALSSYVRVPSTDAHGWGLVPTMPEPEPAGRRRADRPALSVVAPTDTDPDRATAPDTPRPETAARSEIRTAARPQPARPEENR